MTEKEIEQKADEYARTKEKLYKEPYLGCIPTTYTIICNSYIDGAKSRDSEIEELKVENGKLSKMLEIVLPKALEHNNHIFYENKMTLEQYREELEKRV